jgi:hypothetical protein
MADDIARLPSLWDVKPRTVAVAGASSGLVIGADSERWMIVFQIIPPLAGPTLLFPWSQNIGLRFDVTGFNAGVGRFDQRDWGPFPAGPWYISNPGAGFNLFIVEFVWKG